MSFLSKLLSVKGLKRVAAFVWQSMDEQDRIELLRHACDKAGLDWPVTRTSSTGDTQYRRLMSPEDLP